MAEYLDLQGLKTLIDELNKKFVKNSSLEQYATKDYVNELCSAHLTLKVVDSLPTEDISTSCIYLVAREGGDYDQDVNVYDEYVYTVDNPESGSGHWEKIGTTEADLSGYMEYSDEASSELIEDAFDTIFGKSL